MSDATVRMNLDTSQAKQGVREIRRAKKGARRRMSSATAQAGRRLRNRLGLGSGAIGGFAAVSRVMRGGGGNVDPWAEAMVPTVAAVTQMIDDEIGWSARAKRAAREDIYGFSSFIADTGNASIARAAYNDGLKRHTQEQLGLNILRQDPRFIGPSVSDLTGRVAEGYGELLAQSFVELSATAVEISVGLFAAVEKGFDYILEKLR